MEGLTFMGLHNMMRILFFLSFFLSFAGPRVFAQYTNALIHESSPYLQQHAHNPVNWYPWGEEALEKAGKENKMLIVSVGYAACHWCHVMEHESFSDTAVARIMNEHFVCIKVDREERPDVDQVFMNAAMLTSGSTGWPLNGFALPDGRPFYGATYFERDQWMRLLNYFISLRDEEPGKMEEQAEKVTQGVKSLGGVEPTEKSSGLSMQAITKMVDGQISELDWLAGGMKGEPKFPMPVLWESLLHYSEITGTSQARDLVTLTLNKMVYGGIYDHVGGGFSRYSTDREWKIPHFEKMLYDNAQMVSLYTHAWQRTKDPLYRKVVYETLDFIAREMTSEEGGFYSSIDADSDGEEGAYYVWTPGEIERLLGDDAELFAAYYNCYEYRTWQDGKNVLYRSRSNQAIAETFGISLEELEQRLESCRKILLKERQKRVHPSVDRKQLTSWNALMLRAYLDAYRVFGEESFLEAAKKNAAFLRKHAIHRNGDLTRSYLDGKSNVSAFLDDYAFVVSAWIDMYETTFDESWLKEARTLTEYARKHFQDPDSGMFFYTNNESKVVIARNIDRTDGVIPSSGSEMAVNLFVLGHYFYDTTYLHLSERMSATMSTLVEEDLFHYANWARLEMLQASSPYELAIVGKDALQVRKEFDQHYLPSVLFYGTTSKGTLDLLEGKYIDGQTTIYVCRDRACKMPVTSVNEALEQLKD